MGRSKFPGKPPKTVTRKRIKVLGRPETTQSDSVTVAENIYYGLSLFNETFGDNEKERRPFHGFSSKEAKLSVSYIKTTKQDTDNDKKVNKQLNSNDKIKTNESSTENLLLKPLENDNNQLKNNDHNNSNLSESTSNNNIVKETVNVNKNINNDDEKKLKSGNKSKVGKGVVKFKRVVRTPILKAVNNILDRHQRTRQLRNSTAKRLLQRAKYNISSNNRNITIQSSDKSNAIKKFVLPMRSAHSSRVIKPNKRFIEELEQSPSNDNDDGKQSKKAKASNKNNRNVKSKLKQYKNNSNSSKSLKNYKSVKGKEDTRFKRNGSQVKKSGLMSKTKVKHKINDNINSTSINKSSESSSNESLLLKVLPNLNTPNVESSRVKTRLRIPSETAIDSDNLLSVNNENSIRDNKKIDFINSIISSSSSSSDDNNDCMEDTVSNYDIASENPLDAFESDSSLSESTSESNHNSEDEQSEWTGMKLDGGKVILRKARLKLENKNPGGTEGPFSVTNIQHQHHHQQHHQHSHSSSNNISNNNSNNNGSINSSLTGTVKCGVCGAVRFYRFVKQARKFGIYSCESCRKFISKIIKHQACAKSTNTSLPVLQCHKGDGLCLVPPVVRSQQWNLMRCAYKARCPACWLKMCLKCYNIPTSIKAGLNTLLPPLLRDPLMSLGSINQDSNEVICGQKNVSTKINWPAEDSLEKNLFKSAISWTGIQERKVGYQSGQGLLTNKFNKVDYPISMSLSKKRKKDTRIKIRKKIKSPLVLSPPSACSSPTVGQSTQSLRQRVDLKGPRVKHVCRSASVALGQPIATFPSADEKDESDVSSKSLVSAKIKDEEKRPDTREKVSKSNRENNANSTNNSIVQMSYVKKNKIQSNNLVSSNHSVRALAKLTKNKIHEISIDFWEQYDPTEVGAKGFALIASEIFPIPAICFLCGSAGKESLIHCQCCCEPYHAFCLEPSEWNACVQPDWCCPRCTICQTCSLRTGPKLSCIRCRQSFHHSCLSKSGVNARLYSPDRPYICQNCVKCKSCGSEGVNVYVGNLPLCSMCFKLRQRGNYCPLCQRCYNENDFNTKMMECNECSCWVHAQCEGLSDEFYQVLSYLPDSIEFTCSQCSPNQNSTSWRSAIDKELKSGFVAVLKSLSKNRKVCNALNWSPRKECLCKPIVSVRKLLDFSDADNNTSKLNNYKELTVTDNNESEDNNYDKYSNNGDNKIDPLSRFDFEVDEQQQQQQEVPRRGLRKLKQKFHLKECSVRVKNCIVKDGNDSSSNSESNNHQSLNTNYNSSTTRECMCLDENILMKPSPSLMSVKRKVNNNEYQSLFQFHCDMDHVVNRAGKQDLTILYHRSLQEIFPWFDPNQAKVNSYDDELSSSSTDIDGDGDSSVSKLNDSILETWKEEVVKASKAITMRTGNIYSEVQLEDTRLCALCKATGDGKENREGRLLYCGQNEWVHANCALWSNEVFEEIDGSLQNVHSAISRGRMIRCGECGKKGASVGCCAKNCGNTFHYPCARNAGLGLNDDKTIYCSLHLSNCINKNQNDEDNFSLKRLVYVEIERKKKKFVEPDKVKVMIGSLMVDCLGTIVPEFSDTADKLIPTNYKCSRLYWSTKNPMKIVRYYIRTYIKTCTTDINLDLDHNVTIDHSKEQEAEERQKIDNLIVKQTLDSLIDSVYNREMDDNLAEQNNTDLLPPEITDVIFKDLPHDLLDGISMQDIFPKMSYEDFLAMDLRNDGIFGNDILKDEMLSSDVDDEMIKLSGDNKLTKDSPCISDIAEQNDIWLHLEAKSSVQEFMDDLLNSKSQKFGGKELKRSKSEVIGGNALVVGNQRRHHQRSCSLTWSCKLDGTYGPTVKRRKLSRPSTAITGEVNSFVVDSAEKNSMFHELRIPESIMVTVGRTTSPTINESVREFKYCIEDPGINRRMMPTREDNKDHKRLLWHTRQQPLMLQVDGPADPSSASECSSPEYDVEEKLNSDGYKIIVNEQDNLSDTDSEESLKIPQLDGADDISSDDESHSNPMDTIIYVPHTIEDGPVTCKRCQCTYRTHDSYNRHLSNCDIVTTSDSDSETIDHKCGPSSSTFFDDSFSPQFVTLSSPSQGRTLSTDYPDIQATSPLEASVPSPHTGLQIEPIAQALITPQIHSHETVETLHQTVLTSNEVIVQTQYTRTTTTLPNSSATVLPQDSSIKIIEITDSPTHEQTSPSITLSANDSNHHQAVVSPYVSQTIQSVDTPVVIRDIDETHINQQQQNHTIICNNKVLKPKPRVVKAKTKMIKPQYVKNTISQQHHLEPIRYQTIHQNTSPMVHLQQAPRAAAPTVILQQVPSSGIMSAYVDTLQQQSDQNLQYITTIGGQEAAYKPQFISTNQLVPGAYIHAASDNLLALSNGGISVLPSVQIGQPQPTVLGTIIQQQPNAIQCGVISSEQLVLSSTPTLEMFTDSTGSMFVSSQPMYYGLETIVSNTVMSSSQFVAGAVPQVLASSYQTTTQVFQASKLMEPIVDVQTIPSVSTVQAVQGISSVPVQTVPAQNQNVPTVQSIQSIPTVPNIHGSYVVMNPQATDNSIPTALNNHTSVNITPAPSTDQNFDGLSSSIISTEPVTAKLRLQEPEIVNSVAPYIDMSSRSMSTAVSVSVSAPVAAPAPRAIQNHQSIPRIAVRPSPVSQQAVTQPNYSQWKFISEPIYNVEQHTVSSSTRPYLDSKHVSENTSMIKSSLSSKVSPLSNHCVTQRDIIKKLNSCDVINNVNDIYVNGLSSNYASSITSTQTGLNINNISNNTSNNYNKIITSVAPTRPMNRVLPMQAVVPKPETIKPDISDIEEPTKEIKFTIESEPIESLDKSTIDLTDTLDKNFADKFFSDKPLIADDNLIDDEILFNDKLYDDKKCEEIIDSKIIEEKLIEDKNIIEDVKVFEGKNEQKIIIDDNDDNDDDDDDDTDDEYDEKEESDSEEKVKVDDDHRDKLKNASLKIVLQKQLQDGSYKITHNIKTKTPTSTTTAAPVPAPAPAPAAVAVATKNPPKITSVEILPSKQTPHIGSLQLLPIKKFTLKANKVEEIPRIIIDSNKEKDSITNLSKPKLSATSVKTSRFLSKSKVDPLTNNIINNNNTINNLSTPKKNEPKLMYEIKSQDGFTHTASSMSEVWDSVFQAVQAARKTHNLPPLTHNPLTENLGLDNNATVYLVEQLAGVNRCTKYKPRYHNLKPPKSFDSDILSGSEYGSARAEPFKDRKVHDMFSWLASRHRKQPKILAVSEMDVRRAASTNLPMAMRFRMLKETSKESVGVYHSHIHGRGLFCLRDIEAGEMVIEYAGEVIRASLTDKREKYYDSKHIGCYMFKIDDHLVVDATMKGNAARFINHSCEPNCYSKVVDILGKKHILIFALRRITQGEELTYDYKFPFEEIKIPCTCGSRKCRKYLN
ncbi:histone-lysine N-methyltransferase trithorax [Microplitis demolitor]|uniref:histone-lysine N-methyltransferase trithorax n=1 Tax=Microplitis demolitor TaxID=69319 RepID=UPI0006D51EE7|nr:histone-lysine N-methyltransferase trithorax [Microplitis demolitor]XP_053596804.1 histone-lysine N-methyltransferase trithorax [Microplitis demolitor]XP_053596806.1 histone-lysine N-methyltransferase trithorax [Microplitis demolitor]XP_053596807.1 histone-lysine N-methyltransferase trithorax [Microplitis demolitor]